MFMPEADGNLSKINFRIKSNLIEKELINVSGKIVRKTVPASGPLPGERAGPGFENN